MQRLKIAMPKDANPKEIGSKPVCAYLAIAVATGTPFKEVFDHYRLKLGHNWKKGLYHHDTLKGIRDRGGQLTNINWQELHDFGLYRKSLVKVVAWLRLKHPGKVAIIQTKQHVQIVQDDYVIDQSGLSHITKYWGKRKRVFSITFLDNPPDITGIEVPVEEIGEIMNKQDTAKKITKEGMDSNLPRKEIITNIMNELDIKWGNAAVKYHKVKKQLEEEMVNG